MFERIRSKRIREDLMRLSRRTFGRLGVAAFAAGAGEGRQRFGERVHAPSGIPAADVAARNVVMVHGLYADGSSSIDVVPHLQAAGLNVAVV